MSYPRTLANLESWTCITPSVLFSVVPPPRLEEGACLQPDWGQVEFYACRTGAGDNSVAEWFADWSGSSVTAPTKYVFYDYSESNYGPSLNYGKDPTNPNVHNPADPGEWRFFGGDK